jgi:hypothetical protein
MSVSGERRPTIRGAWPLLAGISLLAGGSAACKSRSVPDPARSSGCTAQAVEVGGRRQLALLVGVGKYKSSAVHSLAGPPHDVRRLTRLLTEQYGFPPENVCTLVDEQATTESFRAAFQRSLVDRARPGDLAVVYFSGHGSRAPDANGDEPDGWDETLLFHDARTGDVHDLLDDEVNDLLARLHARTPNIVFISDSCHSGTVTRGEGAGTFAARFEPPEGLDRATAPGPTGGAPGRWAPAGLPGIVVFSAASDGTTALEQDGRGVFTDALIQALGQPGHGPLSYAQVARQVPPLVAASSPQIPSFQGDLDRAVFGTEQMLRPLSWEVREVGALLGLAGPPLPGMGHGAELRIYERQARPADYADPARSKATVVVVEASGLNAKARVTFSRPGSAAPALGDLALLVRASDDALKISVRFLPEKEAGGIPRDRAEALRAAVSADPDARAAVVLTTGPADFEVEASPDGLRLRGPENGIRNVLASDGALAAALWRHARQKALRLLRGEGGADFRDDQTLRVQLRPSASQSGCGQRRLADWVQSPPNAEQVVPLCLTWNVQVTVSPDAPPKPLRIGGLLLSTDGSVATFPAPEETVTLGPGETWTSSLPVTGTPPLDSQDWVRVFGTQETNPVPWHLLADSAASRAKDANSAEPRAALYRALERYLTPGARADAARVPVGEDTTWTATSLAVRVEANPRFVQPDAGKAAEGLPQAKEYTIPGFDLRPYLPDDRSSATYKVLAQVDALARTQVGYKQHPWREPSDAANLRKGIDCSRTIWFAFTRARLRYNRADACLSTAEMVADRSSMGEEFDRCAASDLRLGDVLVYRDDERGDGHVVFVVDPARRIAVGSHGWDGNAKELRVAPQTGVQYQLIKHQPDWRRWDRPKMELKTCWRYRAFAREAESGTGRPGLRGLGDEPCGDRCLAPPPPAAPPGKSRGTKG